MKQELWKIAEERYSKEFFLFHITPVLINARALAQKLELCEEGIEIVEIASLLHDIARFGISKQLGLDKDHHITGAKIATNMVLKLDYNRALADRVGYCVFTHRGKIKILPETIEAQIVACADAMAHFDGFFYVLKLFLKTSPTAELAVKDIEAKMKRDWDKMILDEAKEMSIDKYKAARSFIGVLKNMSDEQIKEFAQLNNGIMNCISSYEKLVAEKKEEQNGQN